MGPISISHTHTNTVGGSQTKSHLPLYIGSIQMKPFESRVRAKVELWILLLISHTIYPVYKNIRIEKKSRVYIYILCYDNGATWNIWTLTSNEMAFSMQAMAKKYQHINKFIQSTAQQPINADDRWHCVLGSQTKPNSLAFHSNTNNGIQIAGANMYDKRTRIHVKCHNNSKCVQCTLYAVRSSVFHRMKIYIIIFGNGWQALDVAAFCCAELPSCHLIVVIVIFLHMHMPSVIFCKVCVCATFSSFSFFETNRS